MSIAHGRDGDIERELTARLSELAHAFVADLNAQGRLVETGGADTLRRLRQQHQTPPPELRAEPGDAGCEEVTEIEAHPAPGAPNLWEAVTAPRAGQDTPAPPTTLRPLHILDAPDPHPASANAPAPQTVPAPVPPQQTAAPASVTARNVGDGPRAQPPVPAGQPAALEAVPAPQSAAPAPAPERRTGVPESLPADDGRPQPPAAATAARLRAENTGRLEVARITSDHERVTVHIHAVSLGDWEYWLTAIGAAPDAPTHRSGWAQTATGHLDGVEVHLTAEAVPRLLEEAARHATVPFLLGGRVYDLALGHTDRLGQTWHYHGRSQEDDTPLLTLGGTGGPPYPLTAVVTANGPLTPAAPDPAPAPDLEPGP
ncbi:BN159_2729 family protein [Streptomyces cellostaticus]|uniref:BN159_2729 family protein n=1 Tax=Streptomyces TaxID=1883 RepID=UPI0020269C8A|nr:BN159_2729 family protein [Streptomyces cellostaticus]